MELHELYPLFKSLDSLQATYLHPPTPRKLLGKHCKEEEAAVVTVHAADYRLGSGTGHATTHASSLPQPHPAETEPTAGLGGSGYLAQYQIRGVPPNAVDLRVFLAFGTVQTEETKTFINSKGFIIALKKSKSLQLQSSKSNKEQQITLKTEKKSCSFMYCICSIKMCLVLFLW